MGLAAAKGADDSRPRSVAGPVERPAEVISRNAMIHRIGRLVAIGAIVLLAPRAEAAPGDVTLPGEARNLPDQITVIDQAAALVQAAPSATPADRGVEMLAQARKLLDGFLRENPSHAETPRAEMWKGALLTTE